PAWGVHQHDGNDLRLARLDERQRFEHLVAGPEAAGEKAIAQASRTRKSLRVKKYLKEISLGSSAIHGLASCSNGRRMFMPKDRWRPAHSWAAPMTPLPAPVMTIQPASVIRFPKARACCDAGWSAAMRADPKTVPFGT